MSLRLRVQYRVRSVSRFILSFRFPDFLSGTVSKAAIYGIIIFLLVGYVVKMSSLTTGGYEIASLERKIESLSEESKKLSVEVASFQSIASIQRRLPELAMVPVKNISYIKATALTMAER